MGFPKYYATYCVMDGEAGANPFWHASLVLSKQDRENAPIIVDDAIGFYSQPSTTTNPLHKVFKHILGFKVDLQDGHGILKKEDMRFLDGNGLHGITFTATEEQFTQLKSLYEQKMVLEKKAIEELNSYLIQQGMAANGHTRHVTEKALAASQHRDPRLTPFHFTMDITKNGLDSSASLTCKTYALNLLLEAGIIDTDKHNEISGGLMLRAFPRFSPSIVPLQFVSTGAPKAHTSSKEKIYYNREWGRNKLMWATQPLIQDKQLSKTDLVLSLKQHQLIKNMLTRVRTIEVMLLEKINKLEAPYHYKRRHVHLREQVARVQGLYDKFSLASENQLPSCLTEKLWVAETTLNVASMSLTPERMNYPFILRAYESMAARHAMLSLLAMLMLIALISNPIGTVLITTAALSLGYQSYRFFKEEKQFARAHADYTAFFQTKQKLTPRAELSETHDETEEHSPLLSPLAT